MYEQHTFLTPENVELHYPTAGAGSRIIAALIDYTLLTIAQIGLTIGGVAAVQRLFVGPSGPSGRMASEVAIALGIVAVGFIWLLLGLGYFVAFELLWGGQTPGKRLAGLRVIRSDGQPVGFLASLVRNVLRSVDGFMGLGVVVMVLDRSSRRLGDMAAGTLVVREVRISDRAFAAVPIPIVPAGTVDALPNPGRLTLEHHAIVRDYFQRRSRMRREEALALAQQLSAQMAALLEAPSSSREDPELFLATIARAVEARQAYRSGEP